MNSKFVVRTNDDTLAAEDMALIYKQLERMAEHACGDAWRNIRDDLKTAERDY